MTTTSRSEAETIVKTLLHGRLIACANICGPIASHFWWQGRIEKAEEYLVLMKSNLRLFDKLAKTVKEMHSYDVPEILVVSIVEGFQPYLEWLHASLEKSGGQ